MRCPILPILVALIGVVPLSVGASEAHLIPVDRYFASGKGTALYRRAVEQRLFVPHWLIRYYYVVEDPNADVGISLSQSRGKYWIHLRQARPDLGSLDLRTELKNVRVQAVDLEIPRATALALQKLWQAFLTTTRPADPPGPNDRVVIYIHAPFTFLYLKREDGKVVSGKLPPDAYDHKEFQALNAIVNEILDTAEASVSRSAKTWDRLEKSATKLQEKLAKRETTRR